MAWHNSHRAPRTQSRAGLTTTVRHGSRRACSSLKTSRPKSVLVGGLPRELILEELDEFATKTA